MALLRLATIPILTAFIGLVLMLAMDALDPPPEPEPEPKPRPARKVRDDGLVAIQVLDAEGRRLPGVVLWSEDDAGKPTFHRGEESGFRVPPGSGPYQAMGPGHRRKSIRPVEGDVQVRLQRGLNLLLELPPELRLPTPMMFLCVQVRCLDSEIGEFMGGPNADRLEALPTQRRPGWEMNRSAPTAFLADRRSLDLLVHEPGTYQVIWSVMTVNWRRSGGVEVLTAHGSSPAGPYQTFPVYDGREPTVVTLDIDNARLAAMLN